MISVIGISLPCSPAMMLARDQAQAPDLRRRVMGFCRERRHRSPAPVLLHDVIADLPPEAAADDGELMARLGQFSLIDPAEQAPPSR